MEDGSDNINKDICFFGLKCSKALKVVQRRFRDVCSFI